MNLTVESLESMHQECLGVIGSGVLDARVDLLEEYKSLSDNIGATCMMLRDLQIAYESLSKVGATNEWMDIVNKDNKFVIACGIEMPKFFGGEKARTEACMEGAWDTFKKYALKAWELLKKAFDFIIKFIKILLEFKNTQSSKNLSESYERAKKFAGRVNDVVNEDYNVTIPDPEVLSRYLNELHDLARIIAEGAEVITHIHPFTGRPVSEHGPLGVPNMVHDLDYDNRIADRTGMSHPTPIPDVATLIEMELAKNGKSRDKQFYGYVITREGFEAIDPKAIPFVTIPYTGESPEIEKYIDTARTFTGINGQSYKAQLTTLRTRITNVQKSIEEQKKYLEKLGNNISETNAMVLDQCGRILTRTRDYYRIVTGVLAQYLKLEDLCRQVNQNLINAQKEIEKKHPEAFKKP